MLGERIERRAKAVALPRPVVKCVSDSVASLLREAFHRYPLGQILPNEAVRVFVCASLPGVIRRSEVDRDSGSSFDLRVTVKLWAIIDGDRFEQRGMSLNQLDDTPVHESHLAAAQLADERHSGPPFDESNDAVLIGRADDHVHLPVPGLGSCVDHGRSVRDVALAGEPAALLLSPIPLAIPDGLTKVLPERSASLFVLLDVAVDGLMADLEQIEELEPSADLFGAELVAQKRLDQLPLRCAELAVPA